MFNENFNLYISPMWVDRVLRDTLFFNNISNGKYIPHYVSPFTVSTERNGDLVVVSSNSYRREILMRDSLLDTFLGRTWESKVTRAQNEAFTAAYINWKENEIKDYSVSRFK